MTVVSYDQLKEVVAEIASNIDYDIYKDIFVCPEDECAEEQGDALTCLLIGCLEELGFEFDLEDA